MFHGVLNRPKKDQAAIVPLPGISSMSKLGHLSLAQFFEKKKVKNAHTVMSGFVRHTKPVQFCMPDEARDGRNVALIDKCFMVCSIVQRRIKLLSTQHAY